MQPICVLLPVGTEIAIRLWSVVELGIQARTFQNLSDSRIDGPARVPAASPAFPSNTPDHLHILAALFRENLLGAHRCRGGLWLERRELADLLHLLECGLTRLDSRGASPESIPPTLESVSTFLADIRTQMGVLRKPARRQSALRTRSATAAGG